MTMTAKEAIDRLASDPTLSLSFTTKGEPKWWRRTALTQLPVQATRSKCIDKANGVSSDDLLINVLKKNPGLELQLRDYNGYFPYLALHAQAFKNLQAPEGMFVSDGHLCTTNKITNGTVLLAEIRK